MNIKSNKEFSFGRLIDEGKSKEEICALKGMTSKDYNGGGQGVEKTHAL